MSKKTEQIHKTYCQKKKLHYGEVIILQNIIGI